MVLGAGCSLEAPTSLKLSSQYSEEVHRALVADDVLVEGECSDPSDLSVLAEVVFEKTGSQVDVVRRLPAPAFRLAPANRGYVLGAALMLEGAVSCICTLNYDLALTDALRQVGADDVGVIAGPSALREFGSKAVIYLHRNVDEADPELWILRRGALESEWRSSWEELVASRIAASPVLLFAGLGSPAAVLTESVERVRGIVEGVPDVYLVDPSEQTPFAEALALPEGNVVRSSWSAFMELLAARVTLDCCSAIRAGAVEIATEHEWDPAKSRFGEILDGVESAGLLTLGAIRARWRGERRPYCAETPESTASIAYLMMTMGQVLNDPELILRVTLDGLVEVRSSAALIGHTMGVHGGGVRRWAAVEQMVESVVESIDPTPDVVLAGGFTGTGLGDLVPPSDIVAGNDDDDIVSGWQGPRIVDVEAEMSDGRSFEELVA